MNAPDVDDHDRAVFPHDANHEPQDNADKERENVPGNDVQPRQAIADKLNGRGDPFDDIDSFHRAALLFACPTRIGGHDQFVFSRFVKQAFGRRSGQLVMPSQNVLTFLKKPDD